MNKVGCIVLSQHPVGLSGMRQGQQQGHLSSGLRLQVLDLEYDLQEAGGANASGKRYRMWQPLPTSLPPNH